MFKHAIGQSITEDVGDAERREPLVNSCHSTAAAAVAGAAAGAAAAAAAARVPAAADENDALVVTIKTAAEHPPDLFPSSAPTEPLLLSREDQAERRISAASAAAAAAAAAVYPAAAANAAAVGDGWSRYTRIRRRNVSLLLAFTALTTIFFAFAQGPVFDMYIFILGNHSTKWVGDLESLSGVVALIVAAPVGYIVDKYPRDNICKVLCVLGIAGTVLSFWGVYTDSLSLIVASLVVWGLFLEASNSSTNAIFADSLPRGQRTQWFSWKGMLQSGTWALSPLLSICFFLKYEDNWELKIIKHLIIFASLLFGPLSSLLLCFFVDLQRDRRRGRVQPHITNVSSARSSSSSSSNSSSSSSRGGGEAAGALEAFDTSSALLGIHRVGVVVESPSEEAIPEHTPQETEGAAVIAANDEQLSRLPWLYRSVPFIVSTADLVRSMGAGMTVKFFPIFFTDKYNFSPVQLSLLGVAYGFSIVFFISLASKISKYLGRAFASQLLSLLGLLALGILCYSENIYLLVVAHLIRGGLQNSNYPIDRSVIVDFSKSTDRGKWSAVETFTSTIWSGSAFLGGILAEKNYTFAFKVTAAVYGVAWLLYLPLVFIVPAAERALAAEAAADNAELLRNQAAAAAASAAAAAAAAAADAAASAGDTATTPTDPAADQVEIQAAAAEGAAAAIHDAFAAAALPASNSASTAETAENRQDKNTQDEGPPAPYS